MNRPIVIASLAIALIGVAGCQHRELTAVAAATGSDDRECGTCHSTEQDEYRSTAMAVAASTVAFLQEWRSGGSDVACLRCHAPQGGEGVTCIDCHGIGKHPYPPVAVPQRCAQCHDAPGENTVRTFLVSSARDRGENCLSCHAVDREGRSSHAFSGPSQPRFLQEVARLRWVSRVDASRSHATVQIRHRAGHALPGGTTGRAVWLWAEGVRADGTTVWSVSHRFGWEHRGDGQWEDRTLPPGQATLIELPDIRREGTVRVRVRLTYHYRAGGAKPDDPNVVMLDQLTVSLTTLREEIRGSRLERAGAGDNRQNR